MHGLPYMGGKRLLAPKIINHIITHNPKASHFYDLFGGSGTTAKMAHKLKRDWILSEISAEYCGLAQKRIDPYLKELYLF